MDQAVETIRMDGSLVNALLSTYQVSYIVGSKSFRPDIQKPRQMENTVRDI